jgi:cobalt/nickel transport system permease protein
MQPIHLAIGVVEGLITATVVSFVWKARPEVLDLSPTSATASLRPVLVGLSLVGLLTAGVLSWFASEHPDGLEWSVAKTTGSAELTEPGDGVHGTLRGIQERTAFLPDYGFPESNAPATAAEESTSGSWGRPNPGTSVAGLVGGGMTLVLATGVAWLVRKKRSAASPAHRDGNARAFS